MRYALLMCIGLAATSANAAVFYGLGNLAGNDLSAARTISSDGMVAGWSRTWPTSSERAVVWMDMAPWAVGYNIGSLPLPAGGTYTSGGNINRSGSLVVGSANVSGATSPAVWSGANFSTVTLLPRLPGSSFAFAQGAATGGSVVVGFSSSFSGYRAVAWKGASYGTAVNLGTLGAAESYGVDVTADGSVIVGYSDERGIFWSGANWQNATALEPADGYTGSAAEGITDDGLTICGRSFSDSGYIATVWRGTGYTTVTPLALPAGATSSTATGISDDGAVVVGVASDDYSQSAAVWDANGGRWLTDVLASNGLSMPAGWTSLDHLGDVVRTGETYTLVGWGIHDGRQEAFTITGVTVPEPAIAATGLFVGMVALTRRRRRPA